MRHLWKVSKKEDSPPIRCHAAWNMIVWTRALPAILDPGVKETLLDGTMMSWKDLVEVFEEPVGFHLSWLTGQSQHVTIIKVWEKLFHQ